jgi:hypothetical protein
MRQLPLAAELEPEPDFGTVILYKGEAWVRMIGGHNSCDWTNGRLVTRWKDIVKHPYQFLFIKEDN